MRITYGVARKMKNDLYTTDNIGLGFDGKRCKVEIHDVTRTGKRPNVHKKLLFEVVKVKSAVAILPRLGDDEYILLENYRYPIGKRLYELPAGLIEEGEEPSVAAIRECVEETGYFPSQTSTIGSFYTSPGFTDEQIHIFFGWGLQKRKQALEDAEDLTVKTFTEKELLNLCRAGHIRDMKTMIALQALFRS